MRKNALLPMVLLLATAGCACIRGPEIPLAKGQRQPAEERKALFCAKGECTVAVTVDKNCNVRAEPYYLVMAGNGAMTIRWTIDGGTFAPSPIRWKQAAAREVFRPTKESSPREVAYTNNRTIGVFNYGITVMRDGKTCPELDPTGINDMP